MSSALGVIQTSLIIGVGGWVVDAEWVWVVGVYPTIVYHTVLPVIVVIIDIVVIVAVTIMVVIVAIDHHCLR